VFSYIGYEFCTLPSSRPRRLPLVVLDAVPVSCYFAVNQITMHSEPQPKFLSQPEVVALRSHKFAGPAPMEPKGAPVIFEAGGGGVGPAHLRLRRRETPHEAAAGRTQTGCSAARSCHPEVRFATVYGLDLDGRARSAKCQKPTSYEAPKKVVTVEIR